MADMERLVEVFAVRPQATALSKLDALVDLERLDDPHIVPFLANVLANQHEHTEVRIHVLKQLRDGRLQPADRRSVGKTLLSFLRDRSRPEPRLQAVPALAEFTKINNVPVTLGGVTLGPGDSIDVRYSAFTSL